MATIVDLTYYKDGFRLGSAGVIPDSDFPFWSKRAVRKIIRNKPVKSPTDELKSCVCAVAEALYIYAQATGTNSNTKGTQQPITGFSNDGYSVTYQDTMKKYREMSEKDFNSTLRGIIMEYLDGTIYWNDFVFRGVGQ